MPQLLTQHMELTKKLQRVQQTVPGMTQSLIQHLEALGLFPALVLPFLGSLETSISSPIPWLAKEKQSLQVMVLGELVLEGTSNQVLVVYYLGKASDFQVRWMKTPIEIKHILKSSLEASFPALKGNFSEKTGGFFCFVQFCN